MKRCETGMRTEGILKLLQDVTEVELENQV